jgi:hypothetical protein
MAEMIYSASLSIIDHGNESGFEPDAFLHVGRSEPFTPVAFLGFRQIGKGTGCSPQFLEIPE